jgi:hypothetical protein
MKVVGPEQKKLQALAPPHVKIDIQLGFDGH